MKVSKQESIKAGIIGFLVIYLIVTGLIQNFNWIF